MYLCIYIYIYICIYIYKYTYRLDALEPASEEILEAIREDIRLQGVRKHTISYFKYRIHFWMHPFANTCVLLT
jgi:hypothetical protein